MLPPGTAVTAFMRRAVDAANEQQTVVDAMVQLFREDVEVLPVVSAEDSARVVGVVSPRRRPEGDSVEARQHASAWEHKG
jgi:CBS-domain-containing membrane protein